jgi:pimeloyl-ACP methyl ester carboxylesterase
VRVEKTPSVAFVYIGGTVTSSLSGGSEPWDMTSNIAAMVGQASDSERGARAAHSAACVTNADRIVVVGHSQGGLVAQRLASDPQLRVSDVVLVGSPQTPGTVAPGVHVVALEHRNDPIPALGGMAPEGRADVTVAKTPPCMGLWLASPGPAQAKLPRANEEAIKRVCNFMRYPFLRLR